MNIGIFTDTYSPQINGVITSINTLKEQLENLGHTVYIITVSHPESKPDEKNVFRLLSFPVFFAPQYRLSGFYSKKYYKIIKELNLDIIHTQTEFTIAAFARLIAKKLNIPIVHTYHTMWEDYAHYITGRKNSKLTPKAFNKISKVICNKYDKIITPTNKSKQALLRYEVTKPIEIIPTGIDLKPFNINNHTKNDFIDIKNEYNISEDKKILVFIGRLGHEKKVDVVLNNISNLLKTNPEIIFLIIGDGPARSSLEKLVKKLNISNKVIFAGKKPWSEIGKYYALGDAFVSASTSETQGLTFLEAMASKTVVISKYEESLDDVLIDKHNGRFFYNDTQLEKIILEVLYNTENTKKLEANALETVKKYSAENFGLTVEGLYKDMINNYK